MTKSKMAAGGHIENLTFFTNYHKILCNVSFYGFFGMQNPFLMLFLYLWM